MARRKPDPQEIDRAMNRDGSTESRERTPDKRPSAGDLGPEKPASGNDRGRGDAV